MWKSGLTCCKLQNDNKKQLLQKICESCFCRLWEGKTVLVCITHTSPLPCDAGALLAQPACTAGDNAAIHDDICAGQEAQAFIQQHREQRGNFFRLAVAFQCRILDEHFRLPAFQRAHGGIKVAGGYAQATHVFGTEPRGIGFGKPDNKMLADGGHPWAAD